MRRGTAVRRHQRAVVVIAAMAGLLIVLLQAVAPMVERAYDARGIEPTAAAGAIFRVGHYVADRVWLVACLVVVLIAWLWNAFGLLDRPSAREHG